MIVEIDADSLPADKGPKDRNGNNRTCIVTRESGSPEELIRFVAGPDGVVVADLKRQLPGRGCWVKSERQLVEKAVAKKLFARALRAEAKADAGLARRWSRDFSPSELAGMMNMARKAGQFVSGATKTDAGGALGLAALAVFHAIDAAADGVSKIDQARKAMKLRSARTKRKHSAFPPLHGGGIGGSDGPVMPLSMPAALAGQAGEGVVKRAIMLEQYRWIRPGPGPKAALACRQQ
jgi:predicted RNA-binding protein YlxR (DUF448 family)